MRNLFSLLYTHSDPLLRIFTPILTAEVIPKALPPIPNLELLNEMVKTVQINRLLSHEELSSTVIIGVQHILETTVSLIDAMIALGISPENIYLTGKCYSSSLTIEKVMQSRNIHLIPNSIPTQPGTFEETFAKQIRLLWETLESDIQKGKQITKIIVLDDGGCCLEQTPSFLSLTYPMAGIEQTRGGIYEKKDERISIPLMSTLLSNDRLPFPVIPVALSAAKKYLESTFIAQAVFKKVSDYITSASIKKNAIMGVIGTGFVGRSLIRNLLEKGYKVAIYDDNENAPWDLTFVSNNENLYRYPNKREFIRVSDYIFGCSGQDVTSDIGISPFLLTSNKYFISCSSKDIEFLTLIKSIFKNHKKNILSDFVYHTNNDTTLTVVSGGFPINFDRKPGNVPAKDIALTQGLMLGGVIQAILSAQKPLGYNNVVDNNIQYILDPYIQQYVVFTWLKSQMAHKFASFEKKFKNIKWIAEESKLPTKKITYRYDPRLMKAFDIDNKNKVYITEPLQNDKIKARL